MSADGAGLGDAGPEALDFGEGLADDGCGAAEGVVWLEHGGVGHLGAEERGRPLEEEGAEGSVGDVGPGGEADGAGVGVGLGLGGLLGDEEALVWFCAAAEVVVEADGEDGMGIGVAGHVAVVVPGGGVEEWGGFEEIDGPGDFGPVGEDEFVGGVFADDGGFEAEPADEGVGEEAAVVELDAGGLAAFGGVCGEDDLVP